MYACKTIYFIVFKFIRNTSVWEVNLILFGYATQTLKWAKATKIGR